LKNSSELEFECHDFASLTESAETILSAQSENISQPVKQGDRVFPYIDASDEVPHQTGIGSNMRLRATVGFIRHMNLWIPTPKWRNILATEFLGLRARHSSRISSNYSSVPQNSTRLIGFMTGKTRAGPMI